MDIEVHLDLCRGPAAPTAHRLSRSPDGLRVKRKLFFMIFLLPGRRGLADFQKVIDDYSKKSEETTAAKGKEILER